MLASRLAEHDDTPADDQSIVVLRSATWGDFQRALEMRGDVSSPRVAFLDGVLELMTPSRAHEGLKFNIGRLLEV